MLVAGSYQAASNKQPATMPHRQIILMSIFIALAVAVGQDPIPNVELVSATIFLSGVMLGAKYGVAVGAIATFLFSFFNAYGPAAPPLLIAQMFGMMLTGLSGGLVQKFFGPAGPPAWFLGLAGLMLTFVYDLLTTVSSIFILKTGWPGLIAAIATGFLFFLLHQISNTLIFALFLPTLIRRLRQSALLQSFSPIAKTITPPELQPSVRFTAERKS
jgi:hypothetical protein